MLESVLGVILGGGLYILLSEEAALVVFMVVCISSKALRRRVQTTVRGMYVHDTLFLGPSKA